MKTALICVDVQRDFLPGGALPVPEGDAIVGAVRSLGAALDGPVFASLDWHPPDHCSFATWPVHCVAGTLGAALHPAVASLADELFFKGEAQDRDSYSAFGGRSFVSSLGSRSLSTRLRDEGIERLIIVGLATDYCVAATAHDALDRGFEVWLVPEAMRGIDPEDSESRVAELVERGAVVVPLAEIVGSPA